MHIPDGMLEARTWVPAWLGSAGVLGWALRRLRKTLSEGDIVLMAVMAALVFALQMLNFPVAGGTSGHFSGGAAAAIVLGVVPAMVVMAAVVTVQAVFFADGGITALGANMLTMAIIGPLVGAAVYAAVTRVASSRSAHLGGAFAAGWLSVMAAALTTGVLLWSSGRAPLGPALLAMGGWHALIGVGEGAITAGLLGYLLSVRPDLLPKSTLGEASGSRRAAIGLGLLALLAASLSFVASSRPDGLQSAYRTVGSAFKPIRILIAPLSGYSVPGVSNQTIAGVLAALVGVIVTSVLVFTLLSGVRSRRERDPR